MIKDIINITIEQHIRIHTQKILQAIFFNKVVNDKPPLKTKELIIIWIR